MIERIREDLRVEVEEVKNKRELRYGDLGILVILGKSLRVRGSVLLDGQRRGGYHGPMEAYF